MRFSLSQSRPARTLWPHHGITPDILTTMKYPQHSQDQCGYSNWSQFDYKGNSSRRVANVCVEKVLLSLHHYTVQRFVLQANVCSANQHLSHRQPSLAPSSRPKWIKVCLSPKIDRQGTGSTQLSLSNRLSLHRLCLLLLN
jgi:hypothetical protein